MCDFDCLNCKHDDCIEDKLRKSDIAAQNRFDRELLPVEPEIRKRRKRQSRYSKSKKGKARRKRAKAKLPCCNDCGYCRAVITPRGTSDTRLCIRHWQLIESKVTTSPRWCELREKNKVG